MTDKHQYKVGDEVIFIGPHFYGNRRHGYGSANFRVGMEESDVGKTFVIQQLKTLDGDLHVDIGGWWVKETGIEPAVKPVTDEEIRSLFGVSTPSLTAQEVLRKHYLKDGVTRCAGCSWSTPNRHAIRKKFAEHLTEMLDEAGTFNL